MPCSHERPPLCHQAEAVPPVYGAAPACTWALLANLQPIDWGDVTYLYIYENNKTQTVYIGVADSMDRIWQSHNADAEKLRDSPGTVIRQTAKPFSTRRDALQAEAIAIHIAALGGKKIKLDNDQEHLEDISVNEDGYVTVNRAGTSATQVLVPAILRREGTLDYESLHGTVIVTIAADEMDARPAPYGGVSAARFSERARQWWKISREKQPKIQRLIAVLAGSGGVVLGDWKVDQSAGYGPENDVIPLIDPSDDDPNGVKGKRLVNFRGQVGHRYSNDIRGA